MLFYYFFYFLSIPLINSLNYNKYSFKNNNIPLCYNYYFTKSFENLKISIGSLRENILKSETNYIPSLPPINTINTITNNSNNSNNNNNNNNNNFEGISCSYIVIKLDKNYMNKYIKYKEEYNNIINNKENKENKDKYYNIIKIKQNEIKNYLNELNELINEFDNDITIRRIILQYDHIVSTISSNQNNELHDDKLIQLGDLIDDILLTRPWWRVNEEFTTEVIIDRIAMEWEPHIRFLSSIHFPSEEVCSKTPLLIGKYDCTHPGWGAVIGMYEIALSSYPYVILQPYVSYSNDPNQNTAFITGSDCLSKNNKWECAFLLSTNCTLPSIITDCNSTNCIPEDNYVFTTFYSYANRSAHVLDIRQVSEEKRLNYQTTLHSDLQKKLSKFWKQPTTRYILPYNQQVYTSRWPSLGNPLLSNIPYLLLRYNSFYRLQMSRYLKYFYDSVKPYFQSTDTCTVIHFRRGDRATSMDRNDIRDICYNMTQTEDKMCLDYNQNLHPCNSVDDYGCGNIPFGLVNLNRTLSYLDDLIGPINSGFNVHHRHQYSHSHLHSHSSSTSTSSESRLRSRSRRNLHSSSLHRRNILLLSDDYEFLVSEVEKLKYSNPSEYSKYNFLIPPPDMLKELTHKQSRHHDESFADYFYMRANSGTKSGVYFHSIIKLARQCNSFIGHFGSSVTKLFYSLMCVYHNGLEGYCPPLFNIEWDKQYYNDILESRWKELGLKFKKRAPN